MKDRIKIAIQPEYHTYSDLWIEYCEKNNYSYILVDSYRPDILRQVEGCTHFLWNFQFFKIKDMLFAKQLLYSMENLGIKVFPNFNTMWHYDDKIGQKYLLESIGAPFVNTSIFYDKKQALIWAQTAQYPAVFKLTGGASSKNVKLINSRTQAEKLIKTAFSDGFNSSAPSFRMKENWRKFKKYRSNNYLRDTFAGMKNILLPTSQQKLDNTIEKGYFYLQEFMPGNLFDMRIIVVGNRALGFKRYVRDNDFRASGSGIWSHDKEEIDIRCVKIAYEVAKKLNSQSVVFDFVFDQANEPKIIEISYCSEARGYEENEGYWDRNLNWISDSPKVEYWIIEDLLAK